MKWLAEIRRRLAVLFRRDRFDRDLEEEMQSHLEMQVRDNLEAGMDAEEARYAAMRQFGNVTLLRERSREAWGWGRLESVGRDLRQAVQTLSRSPSFTAVAVVTLALGIGATTAVFSVVNAVLIRPLPFKDPGCLVMLWERWEKRGEDRVVVSPGNFTDWKQQSNSFEDMAAIRGTLGSIEIDGEPVEIPSTSVTANFFDVVGVKPILGRSFLREDAQGSGQRVVVLGHGLWQRLGSDRHILGKSLPVDRKPHMVVGIMPPGFGFPNDAQVWFAAPDDDINSGKRGSHYLRVVGRLKPGVSVAHAQAEMNTIAARLRHEYPKYNAGIGCNIVPLQEQIVGEVRRSLLVFFGAVVCILLIACANVANLLLARAAGRRQEIAVRVALGAGRWRVIRTLLTESMLLALMGGALGLLCASWLVQAFVAIDPVKLPRVQEVAVDRGVLLFTFLAAVLTGVLFGLTPALRVSRPDLNQDLKEGGEGRAAGSIHGNRSRATLAAAQVALTIVLLVAASLLVRSFILRVNVPPGFRPDGVLGVELPWAAHRQVAPLLERIRAVPGVEAAGAGTAFPHEPAGTSGSFYIEGLPGAPEEEHEAGMFVVTAGYFRAAGMTLRKGRLLTDSDTTNSLRVAVINDTLARRFFPGQDPIGRRLRWGEWCSIVGVVADVKGFSVDGDPMPAIYVSNQQAGWGNPVHVLIRTAVPPESLAAAVRKEIRALNKRWVIGEMAPIEDLMAKSVVVPRFYMMLVAGFALLALSIASIGVYGAINYSVSRRTHEFGIRMALGADRGDIVWMVIRQGLVMILGGATIGLAAAWVSGRVLESLLFQVRPRDAWAFAAATVILIVTGLAACYVPARRATKIDPMEALRHE